jgi:beta-1,2-mannobiose phosphorylase / 1,2-beta-oligomannan phosphorylase
MSWGVYMAMGAIAPSLLCSTTKRGVVMEPQPHNPSESGGVLNPAGVTGPDGEFYLFPRLVAAHNYSRIGTARVLHDAVGCPCSVERLGVALEPQEPYELVRPGVGGCEDARVTFLAWLHTYVMAYTALGPQGPHVALASSPDLRRWTRHGLVDFAPEREADFNVYVNKDAMLIPEPVRSPTGEPALALLHRPVYAAGMGATGRAGRTAPLPTGVDDARPSIWLSYCPLHDLAWLNGDAPPRFAQHHLLVTPQAAWEADRIGGGTVPVRTAEGWLTFYHGVARYPDGERCYQTGALLLEREDPRHVLARSAEPLFGPETVEERVGVVNNVVFPTAVEERRNGLYVYYGMADWCIGVAQIEIAQVAEQALRAA